jgi:hypothetical protein
MGPHMRNMVANYLNVGDVTWAVRRRIVVLTLLFCAGIVIYCATPYMSLEKATLLVTTVGNLATFVIGFYVFGPIMDDVRKAKWRDNLPSDQFRDGHPGR